MNRQEFIKKINDLKGAHFVTIFYETQVKMNKFAREKDKNGNKIPNPYFEKIMKRAKVNGQINFNYENAVNNRREKEGTDRDFQSKGLNWKNATKEHNKSIIEKDGKFYLQFRIIKVLDSEYFEKGTNKKIDKSQLKDYLPPSNNSGSQGVDEAIKIININIDNIKKFTLDKTSHIFEIIRREIKKILSEQRKNK
jgi:hypothetical protein